MRTVYRTRSRDVAALAAAMIAVGASFGAIAIAYGLPTWAPIAMSSVVFAGGAQFLAAGLLAAGNPIAAVLAGLLLNARHLPFSLTVAGALGDRLRERLVGSHLMTDEVVAFTLAEESPAAKRRAYWLVGVTLFLSWNTGTVLGVLLGGAVGDPDAFGLDAAFPAALIALILPSLRDRDTRLVALTGAGIAVLLTPVLPAGLPVLCALLGLLALFRPRRRPDPPAAGPQPTPALDAAVWQTGRSQPTPASDAAVWQTGRSQPTPAPDAADASDAAAARRGEQTRC